MSDTPCGKSHVPTPPQVSGATAASEPPAGCDEDIHDVWLSGARVLGLDLDLDRPEITDILIEASDISGIVTRDLVARRVALRGTRIRGVTLANGQYDDGLIEGCQTNELSLRFTRLRRVTFRDCDLSGADFYNASFDHVTIEGCNLAGATFESASVACLAIPNCNLAAISGAFGLKGAGLDASDLPALAQSLAREAGIEIRDA